MGSGFIALAIPSRFLSVLRWALGATLAIGGILFVAELLEAKGEIAARRDAIEIAWDNLEQDLRRRELLLPGFIDSVRPTAALPGRRALRDAIQRLEARLNRAERAEGRPELIEASLQLEQAVMGLTTVLDESMVPQEQPEVLRARDQVLTLENQIDLNRTAYNEAIQRFNIRLALFPANIAATLFGEARHAEYVPTTLKPGNPPRQNKRAETMR